MLKTHALNLKSNQNGAHQRKTKQQQQQQQQREQGLKTRLRKFRCKRGKPFLRNFAPKYKQVLSRAGINDQVRFLSESRLILFRINGPIMILRL